MKIRLHFSITDQGRFIGHLDLARNFERLLRRAEVPLTFSQGFSPKPKLAFGSALGVGITSAAEYLDVTVDHLDQNIDWVARLNRFAPKAFVIHRLATLKPGVPALMAVIDRAEYTLDVRMDQAVSQAQLDQALAHLLAQEALVITRFHENPRKQKTIDIRPGIFRLTAQVREEGDQVRLSALVRTGQAGNIKAQEPIYALASQNLLPIGRIGRIHRQALYVAQGDQLLDPMDLEGVEIV